MKIPFGSTSFNFNWFELAQTHSGYCFCLLRVFILSYAARGTHCHIETLKSKWDKGDVIMLPTREVFPTFNWFHWLIVSSIMPSHVIRPTNNRSVLKDEPGWAQSEDVHLAPNRLKKLHFVFPDSDVRLSDGLIYEFLQSLPKSLERLCLLGPSKLGGWRNFYSKSKSKSYSFPSGVLQAGRSAQLDQLRHSNGWLLISNDFEQFGQ